MDIHIFTLSLPFSLTSEYFCFIPIESLVKIVLFPLRFIFSLLRNGISPLLQVLTVGE